MDVMATPALNPAHILDSYRKSDAVIIICQNNEEQKLEIAALNEEAARVIGAGGADLAGKPFDTILPERIASTLSEFVEYNDEYNDLMAVLLKIRQFALRGKNGGELPFRLRVIRGEAMGRNPWFHLVLVDEQQQKQQGVFRDLLKQNFKGNEVLDTATGLTDRASITKDLEMVAFSVMNKQVTASFAVLDINNYETLHAAHGQEAMDKLHQHIGTVCKQKLRGEDTVGTLSGRTIAVILVDAPQEEARMVLNRLRWTISTSPFTLGKEEVTPQVNIGFTEVVSGARHSEIIEKCEHYIGSMRGKSSNAIQLVVTQERRASAGEDRRKINVPVEVERRKKDRRH